MNNFRLHQVDVWRFVAIGLVLFAHLIGFSHPWYGEVSPNLVWRAEHLGMVGVKIFFCISGYVICRGMIREQESTGRVDMRAFYRRRIYRILPPLYVYIAAVAVLNLLGVFDLSAVRFAQSGAFLCNVEPLLGSCGWALGHTWSLAYEEQFYLVFPLLFVLLALAKRPGRLVLICMALAAGCVVTHYKASPYLNACCSYVLCMLSGCACALYWDRLQPVLARLPFPVWALAAVLVPGSALVSLSPGVSDIIVPVVLPILTCIAVFGTPVRRPIVARLFCNPLLAHLGRISYGLYLWQQLATWNYGFSSPLVAWGLVFATFVFAHYSFVYFELPLIKRGAAKPGAVLEPGLASKSA